VEEIQGRPHDWRHSLLDLIAIAFPRVTVLDQVLMVFLCVGLEHYDMV